jgi:CDP-diglyceride synthetase
VATVKSHFVRWLDILALQSRIARWFVVIAFTAALLLTLGLAVIQIYDTHYRLSQVIERRPEILFAFVYGWSLSSGLRRRLYSRPLSAWVLIWWAFMSVLPVLAILYSLGLVDPSTTNLINIAVFVALGAMLNVFWAVFELLHEDARKLRQGGSH